MLVDCVAGTDCATAGVQTHVKDSLIGAILLLCPVHTHTQFRASDARSIQFSAFINVLFVHELLCGHGLAQCMDAV